MSNLLLSEFQIICHDDTINKIICSVGGCTSKIRTKKHGLCSKHETRLRNHGDVSINQREQNNIKPLILPSGVIIRDSNKIKILKEIIADVKKRRLYGYDFDEFTTKSYLSKVLDDEVLKRGRSKYSGTKTLKYFSYLENISQKYDSEWGLISITMAEFLSSIVKCICKNGKYAWEDVQKIHYNYYELREIILTEKMHGIKFNDSNELIFIESNENIKKRIFKLQQHCGDLTIVEAAPLLNLHYDRLHFEVSNS